MKLFAPLVTPVTLPLAATLPSLTSIVFVHPSKVPFSAIAATATYDGEVVLSIHDVSNPERVTLRVADRASEEDVDV